MNTSSTLFRTLAAAFLAGAVWASAAARMSTAASPGPNLILNPSMEVDVDGDDCPDGWRTSADVEYHNPPCLGSCPWTLERSASGAHAGTWALHYKAAVIPAAATAPGDWWDFPAWEKQRAIPPATWAIPVISNRFPVIGEREYLFRIWVKARGVRSLHIKYIGHYKGYPDKKTYWTQPLLQSPEGVTHVNGSWDWQPFETRLFVPGGQDWGRLEIWLWQDGQAGELWVDDAEARLLPAGDPEPPAPKPGPASRPKSVVPRENRQ